MFHRTIQPANAVIGHQEVETASPLASKPTVHGEQLHRFQDGDETIVVRTNKQPNGEYTAIDHENYDYDSPVGWGFSTIGAIADLFEKMPRAASEREERDVRAAQFDHARDLRKHEVLT